MPAAPKRTILARLAGAGAALLAGVAWAAPDTTLIERGRYLARAANCAPCHTRQGGELFAGGVAFNTPFGMIYSTNITPDASTGIGAWSELQFRTALRSGVRADGARLYPVFPYTAFTRITDQDARALYAFLKSVVAVRQPATPDQLKFPFNQRSLLSAWNTMYLQEGPVQADPKRSTEWNRGAYLVEALGHCSACHSPRNLLGAERGSLAFTGGEFTDRVAGGAWRKWSTPNLTSAQAGLGLWPTDELEAYLKTGKNRLVTTFGPMNDVILSSTRYLSDTDRHAMAVYLKSLPAQNVTSAHAADEGTLKTGGILYNVYCGTCHLPTGLGGEESAPRLGGGSLVVRAQDPAALINVILYAPQLPTPRLPLKWRPMESFGDRLSDEEVAALASFVRSAWGNQRGAVTVKEVDAQR